MVTSIMKEYHTSIPFGLPVLEFRDGGRSGYVIAFFGSNRVTGYFEFCGGDALVSIQIPNQKDWEKSTGIPISERAFILELLAKAIKKEKFAVSDVMYKIDGHFITFYK